jgi:hypothetical protein
LTLQRARMVKVRLRPRFYQQAASDRLSHPADAAGPRAITT